MAGDVKRRCLFMGAPGAGKGTYGRIMSPLLNVENIAIGDIIRSEIKNKTDDGMKCKMYSDKGELVPDEIVNHMVFHELSKPKYDHGYILDGFPRNIDQAKALQHQSKIDLAIHFNLPDDVLIGKLLGRRMCSNCGHGYNVCNIDQDGIKMEPILPKKEGICDLCGGKLIKRKDDTHETIKNRLEVYKKNTYPLIEFYFNQGVLFEFEVKLGIKDMCRCADVIALKLFTKYFEENKEKVNLEFKDLD